MKNEPKCDNSKELSDAEVEAALNAALRAAGHLFPKTIEEVAKLEATLDMSGVPTPDTNKFKHLLREQNHDTDCKSIALVPGPARVVSQHVDENLAIAARNGGTISGEVRKQMNTDRASAVATAAGRRHNKQYAAK
jgi:hypothetical protein